MESDEPAKRVTAKEITMVNDATLRGQLLSLLRSENAHMSFDEAVADFPMDRINARIPNGSYTPWHILEHLRLTQRDILLFMTDPAYKEPSWPVDYWPARDAMATPSEWEHTIESFRADLAELERLVEDDQFDLEQQVPWGSGQTHLREFLLVADHNAYHIGEFGVLRQVMQTWPASHAE
jgi:hypothetical protein